MNVSYLEIKKAVWQWITHNISLNIAVVFSSCFVSVFEFIVSLCVLCSSAHEKVPFYLQKMGVSSKYQCLEVAYTPAYICLIIPLPLCLLPYDNTKPTQQCWRISSLPFSLCVCWSSGEMERKRRRAETEEKQVVGSIETDSVGLGVKRAWKRERDKTVVDRWMIFDDFGSLYFL